MFPGYNYLSFYFNSDSRKFYVYQIDNFLINIFIDMYSNEWQNV